MTEQRTYELQYTVLLRVDAENERQAEVLAEIACNAGDGLTGVEIRGVNRQQ